MSHYKSDLRDVEFNLFELFRQESALGSQPFEEMDEETARNSLHEFERFAREVLADSFEAGDRCPPIFDPATGSVTLNAEFAATFRAWIESEWWQFQVLPELGGMRTPSTVTWALSEFLLGANPALWTSIGFPTATKVVYLNGTDRDRRIAEIAVDRRWGATMMLTEPEAGSDVGAGRTEARPNGDGTWNLVGTKRFTTTGDSDLAENILHLVLARPVGVDGAGGPGSKGLSLFLVPKYRFHPETGELTGERNGIRATGLEKKMGMNASATCEMTLGADEPAIGWLLGEVHNGIGQMFEVIEDARMMVGTKAVATLSTGYLNALEYAKGRVQGPDMTAMSDANAPRVPIIQHPDVRRSLMTQKAYSEGLRSLLLYTASLQDAAAAAEAEGANSSHPQALSDLLLPVVKGFGTETAWRVLGSECLQTFGGSGYVVDFPIEQYVRDTKIDTVYEGTTAIQAQDLFFRKIVKNKRASIDFLLSEITDCASEASSTEDFAAEGAHLTIAVDSVRSIIGSMTQSLSTAKGGDSSLIYRVGLNATALLGALGEVLVGWLLLRGAMTARAALASDAAPTDVEFYRGKIASARFFARSMLPGVTAAAQGVDSVDMSIMDLDPAAF